MESSDIYKKLDRIEDLPTLPAIALEVNKMLEDLNTSIKDLTNMIEKDQSMASKILKLVNSAFFGLSTKVSSISHAMTLLGFNTVRNAVVSVSVIKAFKNCNSIKDFDIKDFWKHSIGVALISRHISHISKTGVPDDCFICGLLHDMGKLVILQNFSELFLAALESSVQNNISFYEAEKKENPVDHAKVGGYMAKKWRLPLHITDTIRYHHFISKTVQDIDLATTVNVSDILHNNSQNIRDGDVEFISGISALPKINACLQNTSEWFPSVYTEIENASKFFIEELN